MADATGAKAQLLKLTGEYQDMLVREVQEAEQKAEEGVMHEPIKEDHVAWLGAEIAWCDEVMTHLMRGASTSGTG